MSNEYAIVPQEEFSKLQTEVNNVKNNPLGASEDGKAMVDTLKQLNKSMTGLVNLFNTATDELKMEEHDSALISEKIGPLFEKIENLEKQNEKIAKGIVAVADMLKEFRDEYEKNISMQNAKRDIDNSLNRAVESKNSSYSNSLSQSAPPPPSQNSSNSAPSKPLDYNINTPPELMDDLGQSSPPMMGGDMNKPLPRSDSDIPDIGMPKKEEKKGLFHF